MLADRDWLPGDAVNASGGKDDTELVRPIPGVNLARNWDRAAYAFGYGRFAVTERSRTSSDVSPNIGGVGTPFIPSIRYSCPR